MCLIRDQRSSVYAEAELGRADEHPHPHCFSSASCDTLSMLQALVALLDDMAWKTFTIVYENDEGLVRLQEVLKVHGPRDNPITVRQLGEGSDYR